MDQAPDLSRRALLAATLGGLTTKLWAARPRKADDGGGPCATATTRAVLAGPQEPGLRLLVRGRLIAPDGERPAGGAILYAYQTDATGIYHRDRDAPPRLRGFMKTDADGRFEYETIQPGSYPGTRTPAHVHHQAWGGGWPAQWLNDLNFADDPFVSAADKARSEAAGRFQWVLAPRRDDALLVVELNLRLKPQGTGFEESIRHGREACGL
jgi:protocatechuate 3,4-dioxygenase beta subunit